MRTNMLNLVDVARTHRSGYAVASSWSADRDDYGRVWVRHYGTTMFVVTPDDNVVPISRGWGSMTDKCGTRKILTNVNGWGYAQVYEYFG